MHTLKNHRLVGADFQSAYGWHEDECPGLGLEFAAEFRQAYQRLRVGPLLYAIRFSRIRRLNFNRFPYGIFYVVELDEVRVLAVLHGSRETKHILAERRRTFSAGQF
jgi:plasmid stabilization system protein ParE